MAYAIISPKNSFVDFNPPGNFTLEQPDISLPAYNDFGIQFQFKVSGDLLATAGLKAVICDAGGNKVLDQNVMASPLCYQYRINVTPQSFPLTVGSGQPIAPGTYDLSSFLLAIQNAIGVPVPGTTFDYCCLLPSLSIITSGPVVTLARYWDYGFVKYPATMMGGIMPVGTCFRYGIADPGGNVLGSSNKFQRQRDTSFSTLIKYWNDGDAFDFNYPSSDFFNIVRLPFSFRKPIYPVTEQNYIKSTGDIKRISSRIMKEYEGYTDALTEYFHERLIVALKHNHVQFTNSDVGLLAKEIVVEGDYKPDWPDDNTIVVAPAKFKIAVPISDINSNCFSQVSVPCCPPIILSSTSDDTSVTINFDYGNFVTMVNIRYRISGTMAWTEVDNIQGENYTINNLTAGTDIEFQLQSICGATAGSWSRSFTQTTTGAPAVACDGSLTNISFRQDDLSSGQVSFTPAGGATQWKYTIDGTVNGMAITPNFEIFGQSQGSHTIVITPVCSGGALGTQLSGSYVLGPIPTLTEISNGDTGPGGKRTQVFAVGLPVKAGNVFQLQVYSHIVSITANTGDTSVAIATRLAAAINATTEAQWNEFSSAPAHGTNGFPPTATATAAQVKIVLNFSNQFGGFATIR